MTFYKKFSFQVTLRIVLVLVNLTVISVILGDPRLFFNQIILGIILIAQVVELLRFVNKTNRELAKFILAIKHNDFSINFNKMKIGTSFDVLNDSFTEIIDEYKKAKIEKEAQYHYLLTVVEHINIGIISIENDIDIALMNDTAKQLLQVEGIKNWRILKEKRPSFVAAIEEVLPEGRKLIEISNQKEIQTLSVDISSIVLLDKTYTLVTFQDIRNEIEQKEIEAWHKLIRILTHEIMNSATPISSLTETMQMMLSKDELSEETIADLRFSLKTIQKRSNGMLEFIDDYRKLSRVPKPQQQLCDIGSLFKEIQVLVKPELEKHNIQLSTSVEPETHIVLDPKLIEQVLLNLIKNAQHALENSTIRKISVKAYISTNQPIIEVADTGTGIPEKELKEIFVPFFSTKKNGSGIGLSLTKQIMHLHGGTVKVKSVEGEGTTFQLIFKSV